MSKKIKVLIVEDNAYLTKTIEDYFGTRDRVEAVSYTHLDGYSKLSADFSEDFAALSICFSLFIFDSRPFGMT